MSTRRETGFKWALTVAPGTRRRYSAQSARRLNLAYKVLGAIIQLLQQSEFGGRIWGHGAYHDSLGQPLDCPTGLADLQKIAYGARTMN